MFAASATTKSSKNKGRVFATNTAIDVVEDAKESLRRLGGKCQNESLTSDDVSQTTRSSCPIAISKDSLVSARDGRPFFVLCLTESNRKAVTSITAAPSTP